jgi:hypothetical protein
MDYCGPRGIPHSVFAGWDPLDQDKAIMHMLHGRLACGSCGTVPGDWLDDKGEDREPPPYVAVAELCVGCAAIEDKISEIPEKDRSHYHVHLVPREVANATRISSRQDRITG